jgi:CBS domain containing-hemolysin-like protein
LEFLLSENGKKIKKNKYWSIKIFFISFILAAGVSVVAEYFTQGLSLYAAFAILVMIVALGVIADTVGVAFATCDQKPFVAMAAKRVSGAKTALEMLKNADVVSNFCNDVIGDICGIVSGAAGASIALQVVSSGILEGKPISESLSAIVFSSLIAAVTVAGKAVGKGIAMRSNKEIVALIGRIIAFFKRKDNI